MTVDVHLTGPTWFADVNGVRALYGPGIVTINDIGEVAGIRGVDASEIMPVQAPNGGNMPLYTNFTIGTTIFIAASNASSKSQAHADFLCSGSGDQNTVANAVAALPASGGRVVFSEGSFSFSAPYQVVNSNIIFSGMGPATTISTTANGYIFQNGASAISNIAFEHLTFVGPVNQTVSVPTRARSTSGNGCSIALYFDGSLDPNITGAVITNITMRNCAVRNCTSLPIRLGGITGITSVTNCEFTNCMDAGFIYCQEVICSNNHSYMSADNGFSLSRGNTKVTCTGNTVELAAYNGIWLAGFVGASGPQDFACTGNTIKNVGNSGIMLWDAPKYGTVAGNTINQGYNRGASDNLTDINVNGISIRANPSNAPASPTDYVQGLAITGNIIRTAARAGIMISGAKGVTIADNLILDTGTQYYADGVTSIGTNLSAQANPQNIGIFFDYPATVTDIYLRNNTVLDQRATPYCTTAIYPFPPISGVTASGNIQNGLRLTTTLPAVMRSDTLALLTSGEETMPRWAASNATNISMANGVIRFGYFRARKNETVTQIKVSSGSTAAAATPTLVRFGLYSVDSSNNLTLLSAITSDTSIFAATLTDYTRSLAASVTLVESQVYAVGILVVTATTAPTVMGVLCSTPASNGQDPRLCMNYTGQTDLPSSITSASLTTTQSFVYAQAL